MALRMSVIVGITCDRRDKGPVIESHRVRPRQPEVFLKEVLVEKVCLSGGIPLLLPPVDDPKMIQWAVNNLHAVIISGGAFDIAPELYGQKQTTRIDRIEPTRTHFELQLASRCISEKVPILGICGGMQAMVVAMGGTLFQDIATQIPNALEHEQPSNPITPWHRVTLQSERLQKIYQRDMIEVNSTHHQAVADPGIFSVAGVADDGVIEAIEYKNHPFCFGVQWHPELLDIHLIQRLIGPKDELIF